MNVLFYSSVNYYHQDFLTYISAQFRTAGNSLNIINVQTILFEVFRNLNPEIFASVKWQNIMIDDSSDNIFYMKPISELSKNQRDFDPKNHTYLPRNYKEGIDFIISFYNKVIDEYQTLLRERTINSLGKQDINPVSIIFDYNRISKNLSTSPNLNNIYKVIRKNLEKIDFIITPGTNRSVASTLLGSRKVITAMCDPKNSNLKLLEDTKANMHGVGLENNFIDSLTIVLMSKISIAKKIQSLSFCHGAQLNHVALGGFLNYKFRKYSGDYWNTSKVEMGDNHLLKKSLQLENNQANYFNTVFMELNNTLETDYEYIYETQKSSDIFKKSDILNNINIVQCFKYNDLMLASQIHIEQNYDDYPKIARYIKQSKNALSAYNNSYFFSTNHNSKSSDEVELLNTINLH